jgi:enoyl-CoA hydratase/carnithine racemase
MSDQIMVSHQDRVMRIRMARPEKKNALTIAMYSALADALEQAAHDDMVRVVLITGGDDVFTSGNDLRDFAASPPTGPESPVFRFLSAISTFPKPIVAAVNGLAIGIGTTLLLHCDLVVADPAARFSLPFVNLGLVPEAASSLLLPRMLGHVRAAELLLLGDMFTAAAALDYGIINRVSEPGGADAVAMTWATTLSHKAPSALRASKSLLKTPSPSVGAHMLEEASAFIAQLRGPEFAEAVTAFMEKRAPDFS